MKYHQLVPKKDLSLTDKISLHDNLIIQGDNLKVLKALLPTYAGKVKCIYIDPPYNTGNSTWVYNDNVNSPMINEWLGKEVNIEDLTRHDKWLCMMMPRLKLLRELLSEEGVIFISCDDNELYNLRNILRGEAEYDTIFVLETKGIHLKNEDTKYKQDVFALCNELGARKPWKELFAEFPDHDFAFQVVFEDEWQNKINTMMQ